MRKTLVKPIFKGEIHEKQKCTIIYIIKINELRKLSEQKKELSKKTYFSFLRTPAQLRFRRILDILFNDFSKSIITANLLIEIARDGRKALYGHD